METDESCHYIWSGCRNVPDSVFGTSVIFNDRGYQTEIDAFEKTIFEMIYALVIKQHQGDLPYKESKNGNPAPRKRKSRHRLLDIAQLSLNHSFFFLINCDKCPPSKVNVKTVTQSTPWISRSTTQTKIATMLNRESSMAGPIDLRVWVFFVLKKAIRNR